MSSAHIEAIEGIGVGIGSLACLIMRVWNVRLVLGDKILAIS